MLVSDVCWRVISHSQYLSLALSLLLSPFFYAVVMPVFVITTGLDRIELHRIHGLA